MMNDYCYDLWESTWWNGARIRRRRAGGVGQIFEDAAAAGRGRHWQVLRRWGLVNRRYEYLY